jgi:hypothetical protein
VAPRPLFVAATAEDNAAPHREQVEASLVVS